MICYALCIVFWVPWFHGVTSLNTAYFLKKVPLATCVLWEIESFHERVYNEGTVFMKPAVYHQLLEGLECIFTSNSISL